MHGELKQTLRCMLQNEDTEFSRNEEFQLGQRDFVTYMNEVTYLQRMELTGYL